MEESKGLSVVFFRTVEQSRLDRKLKFAEDVRRRNGGIARGGGALDGTPLTRVASAHAPGLPCGVHSLIYN